MSQRLGDYYWDEWLQEDEDEWEDEDDVEEEDEVEEDRQQCVEVGRIEAQRNPHPSPPPTSPQAPRSAPDTVEVGEEDPEADTSIDSLFTGDSDDEDNSVWTEEWWDSLIPPPNKFPPSGPSSES